MGADQHKAAHHHEARRYGPAAETGRSPSDRGDHPKSHPHRDALGKNLSGLSENCEQEAGGTQQGDGHCGRRTRTSLRHSFQLGLGENVADQVDGRQRLVRSINQQLMELVFFQSRPLTTGAGVEVKRDRHGMRLVKLTAYESEEHLRCRMAPSQAPAERTQASRRVRMWRASWASSASRSLRRARKRRFITVPMGIPVRSEISR